MPSCAEELDIHLDFEPMELSDVLSYMQSGKSELGCGSILITEERAKAMDFAITHENDLILVVRSAEGTGTSGASFIDGIASSFYKTFIKEDRWTLVLTGLGVTALVAGYATRTASTDPAVMVYEIK